MLARNSLALTIGLAVSSLAFGQVRVDDAWVRGTVPAQHATGAFMRVTSPEDAKLVAVRSPVAGVAELHEMKMDAGVMKMRPVAAIALPAGKPVPLEPGGYHVMLIGLRHPLGAGESVPLTLTVESKGGKRTDVKVEATVRPLTAGGAKEGMSPMR